MAKLAQKEKFVTKTFRVSQDLWRPIEEKARREGMSVNQLVNQILKRYNDMIWSDRYKALTISPETFETLIKGLSDDYIEASGREMGSTAPKSGLMMVGMPLNLDSIVQLMTRGFDEHMNWFQCDHHKTKDEIIFHMRHSFGRKWSAFLNSYISSMFTSTLGMEVRSEILDGAVTVYARLNKM